jgi:hypothetical protein
MEGMIEVTGRRRERRRKQLLDDVRRMRGSCKFNEEALDRTIWRARTGRGPVIRQAMTWMYALPGAG